MKLLDSGWNNARTELRAVCNLSLSWRSLGDRNDYNWYRKEILPAIPPSWADGSMSGSLEVSFRQRAFDMDTPDSRLLASNVKASDALREVWFDKKGDYVRLGFRLVVADDQGNKSAAWTHTTTTKERKAKLEAQAHFATTDEQIGELIVRLVLSPRELRPAPIDRQGTGSKRVVGGGLPS